MKISVIGLGYVGTVTGACLADMGHQVTFVDVNPLKIEQVNGGISPIVERGLEDLIAVNRARGRIGATDDLAAALLDSEVTFVCVGTPTGGNGDVCLDDVETVVRQVGKALAEQRVWHLVLVTSTVPPGTCEDLLIPLLEKESGRTCGFDFGLAFSPEFLRESSAVSDFRNPPKTVVGASDSRSFAGAAEIFAGVTSDITRTTIRVAETVKFADNAWHAVKVTFANEVGRFCDALAIDSHAVMDIFRSDTRLNISAAYLSPGFAFGGSCLPKDLRTLAYRARALGLELPVIEHVLPSNRAHLDLALRKIERLGGRRIALLGLAFKSGTDDLRESAALELAERLLGKGYDVVIHDEFVCLPRLVGSNREYVMRSLPHIASLLSDDLDGVIRGADIVVVAQGSSAYADVTDRIAPGQIVLDLQGVGRPQDPQPAYHGLVW